MDEPAELQHGILEEQEDPDILDAAGGRAGTAADEHQGDDHDLADWRPEIIVGGAEAGRGDDGDHLKRASRKFAGVLVTVRQGIGCHNDQGGTEDDGRIETQFLVAPECSEVAVQGLEVQGEVHAGEKHEENDDPST